MDRDAQHVEYVASAKYAAKELAHAGFKHLCVVQEATSLADIQEYQQILETAESEAPLQRYLQEHPWMVANQLGSGCRWIKSQPRLGSEFVPDFMAARLDSMGMNWTLIELQSPTSPLFTTTGRQSKHLDEGFRQIRQWREWLSRNYDYARRSKTEGGVGLVGINNFRTSGIVLIGRRHMKTDQDREWLLPLTHNERVDVRSYDWLMTEARQRIDFRDHHAADGLCEDCAVLG